MCERLLSRLRESHFATPFKRKDLHIMKFFGKSELQTAMFEARENEPTENEIGTVERILDLLDDAEITDPDERTTLAVFATFRLLNRGV